MDELINLVAQRTGLPPETARTAVETTVGWLKQKLPPAIAGHLDGVLASGGLAGAAEQLPGELGRSLGGLFGGGKSG